MLGSAVLPVRHDLGAPVRPFRATVRTPRARWRVRRERGGLAHGRYDQRHGEIGVICAGVARRGGRYASEVARSAPWREGPNRGQQPLRPREVARPAPWREASWPPTEAASPRAERSAPPARRGPSIYGDLCGEKATPAASEERSWGAEGGDGEPSWARVPPRLGGRYEGGAAVLGGDLPYGERVGVGRARPRSRELGGDFTRVTALNAMRSDTHDAPPAQC